MTESIDPLWENFLKELGIKKKHQKSSEKENMSTNKIDETTTQEINNSTSVSTTTTSSSTTTTTTTTTTTPSTTTQVTDAPDLFTDDLVANAGSDIHVYYPSNICVLNGTKTKYFTASSSKMIVKWLWTKMDTSPAFGVIPFILLSKFFEGFFKLCFFDLAFFWFKSITCGRVRKFGNRYL